MCMSGCRNHPANPFPVCGTYPWKVHFLILAPLLMELALCVMLFGWWGEPVRQAFAGARMLYPHVTHLMQWVSNWGNLLLYGVVAGLFVWMLHRRDTRGIRFFMAFAVISLLTLGVAVQLMKYGLGMPRPGVPWPPHAFASNAFASFPSGHTANIIVSAIPLAIWFNDRRISIQLSLLVACMAFSRIWLGMHHPVDIVGSLVVGSIAAWLIVRIGLPLPTRRLMSSFGSETGTGTGGEQA